MWGALTGRAASPTFFASRRRGTESFLPWVGTALFTVRRDANCIGWQPTFDQSIMLNDQCE